MFFVMLRDGKQEGEWYFMKGRHIKVKKIIKPSLYFCEKMGISLK